MGTIVRQWLSQAVKIRRKICWTAVALQVEVFPFDLDVSFQQGYTLVLKSLKRLL